MKADVTQLLQLAARLAGEQGREWRTKIRSDHAIESVKLVVSWVPAESLYVEPQEAAV